MIAPQLPTASALARARHCVAWCFLPHVREESPYASRGTALHAYLADCVDHGQEAALQRVPEEYRAACEAIDLARLPPLSPERYAAEVALAYDATLDLGRELGRGLAREDAYQHGQEGEVFGTVDLIGLDDESVQIVDWKTGRQQDLEPAPRNQQVRFLALAACRAYQRERAHVALIRIREDGSPWFDCAELDSLDLDETAGEVNEVLVRIERVRETGRLEYARGQWCRYCPAFDCCPAQVELLRQAIQQPERLAGEVEIALTNGGKAAAYRAWRDLERLVKRIGERVGAVASYQPIDLGEGRVYGFAPGPEKVADADLVHQTLVQAASPEVASAAVTSEVVSHTTKTAIEKALRGVPKPQREQAWRLLRASGALKASATLREHVREEETAPAPGVEAGEAA